MLHGRPLTQLSARYRGLSPQALAHRVRQTLRRVVRRPRRVVWPTGDLLLLLDGLRVSFGREPWVVYLLAVRACDGHRAVFLDPLVWPGAESQRQWTRALGTIPAEVRSRIRGLITDDLRGFTTLAHAHGWVLQLCQFHLLHRLHGARGLRKRSTPDRLMREQLYQLVRAALEAPTEADADALRVQLHDHLRTWRPPGRFTMVVRQAFRRWDYYRAYARYPTLNLPTTTGSVEAMARRIRTLLHRLGNVRTPEALQLWVTALVRLRPSVACNRKIYQPNSFV